MGEHVALPYKGLPFLTDALDLADEVMLTEACLRSVLAAVVLRPDIQPFDFS